MAKDGKGTRAEVGCEEKTIREHVRLNEEDLPCGEGGKLVKQVGSR